jgi:NAD(P)-dependent dehydrogenase (short-subunit alcohol dehydrogenase family)
MKLKDKAAVVTGAGAGIGRAIAREFVKEGAQVAICDVKQDKLAAAEAELKALGGTVLALRADVGMQKDVQALFDGVVKRFGGLDILVNNAAVIHQAKVIDTTEEDWDRLLRNNLKSVFLCCREAARIMIRQDRGGKIVNLSSIHAVLSEPQACAYTAAKGGVEAFSRTLATEVAPHRINVNCIEPGATYTELTIPMYTDSVKKALYQRVPLKEIAQPEWIARGAVFLASDDARYMTGSVLVIDGGYTMDGSLPGAAYWEK